MSAVFLDTEVNAREDERFREHEGDDQPTTGSMPFDINDPDTWPVAKLARRYGIGVWVVTAVVLAVGSCFLRSLLK